MLLARKAGKARRELVVKSWCTVAKCMGPHVGWPERVGCVPGLRQWLVLGSRNNQRVEKDYLPVKIILSHTVILISSQGLYNTTGGKRQGYKKHTSRQSREFF